MKPIVKALYVILFTLCIMDAVMTYYVLNMYPTLFQEGNNITIYLMNIFGLNAGLFAAVLIKLVAVVFVFKLLNGDIIIKSKYEVAELTELQTNIMGFLSFSIGICITSFAIYNNILTFIQFI